MATRTTTWTLAQKQRWVERQCNINAIRPTREQIEKLFNLFYEIDQSGFILCTDEYRRITITERGQDKPMATAGVL